MDTQRLNELIEKRDRIENGTELFQQSPVASYNRGYLAAVKDEIHYLERGNPILKEKLNRPTGLCTSIIKSHAENAERTKFILDAYVKGVSLQIADRCADNWEHLHHLPSEFASFRYRVAQ